MVRGRRSAEENGGEAGGEATRKKRRARRTAGGGEATMEGSVATRKVRAKRFVECFMESFRIVDFLSPIAPGWIYDGRRTRKRTSAVFPTCAARPRATENIKGYYLNSRKVRFLRERGERGPRVIAILHRLVARARDSGESIPVPVIFRIIDVKNILETLINVGRGDIREGRRMPQQSHAKLLLDFNWKTIILVE